MTGLRSGTLARLCPEPSSGHFMSELDSRIGWCRGKKTPTRFGVRLLGVQTVPKVERGLHLIPHFMYTAGYTAAEEGQLFSCGSGSNMAHYQHQSLWCFTPSRNLFTHICISSSQQPFEIGAIFVSISTSSYIILCSEVKCFLSLKQKLVSGSVGIQTR